MTYEYTCRACGHDWEAEQRITAEPLRTCPACGSSEARRVIPHGNGFVLKGSGWFSDGYSRTERGRL
jgi:putative FmdB family regulatory protein